MLKSVGVVVPHGKCVYQELTADPCPHVGFEDCKFCCSLHPDMVPMASS